MLKLSIARLTAACCVATLACCAAPITGHAQPPGGTTDPVVTGPITAGVQGHPEFDPPFRVSDYGYRESEYFISGVARAYGTAGAPAAYTTRIVVYRPADPARFSGNVVLEWGNTTGQVDAPVEFVWAYPQLFAAGDAYVEVTAQQAGVCGMDLSGAPDILGGAVCTPLSLKGYDPVRYRPLVHPGDAYSYDIFSQAARAVRRTTGVAPLGGLAARRVIAVGESQSAIALDNYISSGADRAAEVVDGFVIDADGHTAEPATYRVPTVTVWSEESARPGPTAGPNHVIWPVAGAAHTDHQLFAGVVGWASHSLLGTPAQPTPADANGDYGQEGPGTSVTCLGDDEFPRRYVVDAAIADTEAWARNGTPAPAAPPLQFAPIESMLEPTPAIAKPLSALSGALDPVVGGIDAAAILGAPVALARDDDGTARGGLRLPPVTVPVASYDGAACIVAGTTTALSPARLRALYPTHADYVARMIAAVRESVAARFLTRRDGLDLLARACDSAIPEFGTTPESRQPADCHRLGEILP